ncbi:hypothetical protein ACPC54_18070 [Kitasatospora sp. NPDC094028]
MPAAIRGDRIREHTLNSFTLTVEGLIDPTSHPALEEAVAALRSLLAELPMDVDEASGLDLFLSDPSRVDDYIRRDGQMPLRFTAAGRTFTAVIKADRGEFRTST